MRRRPLRGGRQGLGPGVQCRLRGLVMIQRAPAMRPHGVPVRTVKELEAWIAPPLTAYDKDIPTSEVIL